MIFRDTLTVPVQFLGRDLRGERMPGVGGKFRGLMLSRAGTISEVGHIIICPRAHIQIHFDRKF